MNKLYTLTLFTLVCGSQADMTTCSSPNSIRSTIQAQALATAHANASTNTRMQGLVAQYYQDNVSPDLANQDMRQFMATLQENALANDGSFHSIKHLQAILQQTSRDKITNPRLTNRAAIQYSEAQFLQHLKNDITACTTNLPRLEQSVANEHAQYASDKNYQPYLTHLQRYLSNMQNNYQHILVIRDEYSTYSQIKKEATRIRFYEDRNRLGEEYKQLHETNWLKL